MARIRQEVGGSAYQAQCTQIRMSNTSIRRAVEIIIEGNAGPQAILTLAGKIAVAVSQITDAITTLERIGEAAKNERRN